MTVIKRSEGTIITPQFRIAFPQVFEAKSFKGNDPKYSVVMVFPKDADLSGLKSFVDKLMNEAWSRGKPKKFKSPFRDGEEKSEGCAGFENTIFATASSKFRPGIVNAQREPIINSSDVIPGDWFIAQVSAYAYDRTGNVGIAFGLQNLLQVRRAGDNESEFVKIESPEKAFEDVKIDEKDITKSNNDGYAF